MYVEYFGLREPPFAITPDPAYVYLGRHHQEALAHLLYGVGENGGFVQLTGEVGAGKTTLIRTLLEQQLDKVDVALCFNPRLTVEELLATVCDELGAPCPQESPTLKALLDALNAHLLRAHAAGRRTVLIVDEAQNLSREVLEQIRLLTNLETAKHKLLRIILVGQPELRALLARPDLRQLAQRITARYHLPPLDRRETAAYIGHRLRVAGGREEVFTRSARWVVYHRSGGIPRLINIICDRALLGAYGRGVRRVGTSLVRAAAREALNDRPGGWTGASRLALATGLAGLAIIGAGLWLPPADLPPRTASPVVDPVIPAAGGATTSPSPAPPAAALDWSAVLKSSGEGEANRRLLATWGIAGALDDGAAFCERVEDHQLRCLAGRGDWNAMRRYDHPVLLRLQAPDGSAGLVLLRALADNEALLDIAGQLRRVSLAQLTPLWTGDYLLLWRPQIPHALIGPGASGEAVRWLRSRLALAAGQPPSESLSERFDAALAAQLRAFQRERGLRPDGLAGQRTLVLLNHLAPEPDAPTLRPPVENP
jgi:general secretion pathway protein A